jgi:hypothetical protein
VEQLMQMIGYFEKKMVSHAPPRGAASSSKEQGVGRPASAVMGRDDSKGQVAGIGGENSERPASAPARRPASAVDRGPLVPVASLGTEAAAPAVRELVYVSLQHESLGGPLASTQQNHGHPRGFITSGGSRPASAPAQRRPLSDAAAGAQRPFSSSSTRRCACTRAGVALEK